MTGISKAFRKIALQSQDTPWRSGLEGAIAEQLKAAGVGYHYEGLCIRYTKPAEPGRYTPDFFLKNGIIVETKGYFLTADRKKHKLIKAQYPDLDIRFVFSNPSKRIGKKSSTSYAKWCDDHGFLWARRTIPESWLKERVGSTRLAAAMSFLTEG